MDSRPERTFAQDADELHHYFASIVKTYGRDDYRIGMELTRAWGELIAREASIHDAIQFFVRVNSVCSSQRFGSGWDDCRLRVLGWLLSIWKGAHEGRTHMIRESAR
jgi:hypothetical protein